MTNPTPESIIRDWWYSHSKTHARTSKQAANALLLRFEQAGFYICKMSGGAHDGTCPTCGCEPQHRDGECADKEQSK